MVYTFYIILRFCQALIIIQKSLKIRGVFGWWSEGELNPENLVDKSDRKTAYTRPVFHQCAFYHKIRQIKRTPLREFWKFVQLVYLRPDLSSKSIPQMGYLSSFLWIMPFISRTTPK